MDSHISSTAVKEDDGKNRAILKDVSQLENIPKIAKNNTPLKKESLNIGNSDSKSLKLSNTNSCDVLDDLCLQIGSVDIEGSLESLNSEILNKENLSRTSEHFETVSKSPLKNSKEKKDMIFHPLVKTDDLQHTIKTIDLPGLLPHDVNSENQEEDSYDKILNLSAFKSQEKGENEEAPVQMFSSLQNCEISSILNSDVKEEHGIYDPSTVVSHRDIALIKENAEKVCCDKLPSEEIFKTANNSLEIFTCHGKNQCGMTMCEEATPLTVERSEKCQEPKLAVSPKGGETLHPEELLPVLKPDDIVASLGVETLKNLNQDIGNTLDDNMELLNSSKEIINNVFQENQCFSTENLSNNESHFFSEYQSEVHKFVESERISDVELQLRMNVSENETSLRKETQTCAEEQDLHDMSDLNKALANLCLENDAEVEELSCDSKVFCMEQQDGNIPVANEEKQPLLHRSGMELCSINVACNTSNMNTTFTSEPDNHDTLNDCNETINLEGHCGNMNMSIRLMEHTEVQEVSEVNALCSSALADKLCESATYIEAVSDYEVSDPELNVSAHKITSCSESFMLEETTISHVLEASKSKDNDTACTAPNGRIDNDNILEDNKLMNNDTACTPSIGNIAKYKTALTSSLVASTELDLQNRAIDSAVSPATIEVNKENQSENPLTDSSTLLQFDLHTETCPKLLLDSTFSADDSTQLNSRNKFETSLNNFFSTESDKVSIENKLESSLTNSPGPNTEFDVQSESCSEHVLNSTFDAEVLQVNSENKSETSVTDSTAASLQLNLKSDACSIPVKDSTFSAGSPKENCKSNSETSLTDLPSTVLELDVPLGSSLKPALHSTSPASTFCADSSHVNNKDQLETTLSESSTFWSGHETQNGTFLNHALNSVLSGSIDINGENKFESTSFNSSESMGFDGQKTSRSEHPLDSTFPLESAETSVKIDNESYLTSPSKSNTQEATTNFIDVEDEACNNLNSIVPQNAESAETSVKIDTESNLTFPSKSNTQEATTNFIDVEDEACNNLNSTFPQSAGSDSCNSGPEHDVIVTGTEETGFILHQTKALNENCNTVPVSENKCADSAVNFPEKEIVNDEKQFSLLDSSSKEKNPKNDFDCLTTIIPSAGGEKLDLGLSLFVQEAKTSVDKSAECFTTQVPSGSSGDTLPDCGTTSSACLQSERVKNEICKISNQTSIFEEQKHELLHEIEGHDKASHDTTILTNLPNRSSTDEEVNNTQKHVNETVAQGELVCEKLNVDAFDLNVKKLKNDLSYKFACEKGEDGFSQSSSQQSVEQAFVSTIESPPCGITGSVTETTKNVSNYQQLNSPLLLANSTPAQKTNVNCEDKGDELLKLGIRKETAKILSESPVMLQPSDKDILATSTPDKKEESKDFNCFTDEVFKDPSTFDFLIQFGNSKSDRDLRKESLYVKFDPCVGSPRSCLPRTAVIPEVTILEEIVPSSPQIESVRCENLLDKTFPNTECNVLKNDVCTSMDSFITPKSTSPETKQTLNQSTVDELNILREKVALMQQLLDETERVHKEEVSQLKKQIGAQEYDLVHSADLIKELKAEIVDSIKEKQEMSVIMASYEKTVTQIMAEREKDQKKSEVIQRELVLECERSKEHLANIEKAFADLHTKYESSKKVIKGLKDNEAVLREKLSEYEATFKKAQKQYETLKVHAESQLERANQELIALQHSNQAELSKQKAIMKKCELRISSLEDMLEQKTKENKELMAICDELISKVGS